MTLRTTRTWIRGLHICLVVLSLLIACNDSAAPTNDLVVNAGADQIVAVGSLVTLQGSSNYTDASYRWVFESVPDSSAAVLAEDITLAPNFIADTAGTYELLFNVAAGEFTKEDRVVITADATLDDALEPNNRPGEASRLPWDETKVLSLLDHDWFTFSLEKRQLVTVTFQATQSDYKVPFTIFDNSLNELYSDNNFFSSWSSYSFALEPGSYYLQLREGLDPTAATYSLHLSHADLPDQMYEPNNDVTEATLLIPGQTVNAFADRRDEDWYKLELPAERIVQLSGKTEEPYRTGFILYDVDQKPVNRDTFSDLNDEEVDGEWVLPAGTYYFRFTARNGKYSFIVNAQALPDEEFEPNNSEAEARIIATGFNKQMYIYYGDEDWFRFTLDSRRPVIIDLGESEQLTYSLYQRGSYKSEETYRGRAIARTLEVGTYYLQVTSSSMQGAYPMRFETPDFADAAIEPNDTEETATPITVDYDGSMFISYSDKDYFSFSLAESRIVEFDLGMSTACSYLSLALTIDREYAALVNCYREPFEIGLSPGSYYLRVSTERGGGFEYPLRLSSRAVPDVAYEPNNSREAAVPVSIPFSSPLYLTHQEEDWFRFTLADAGRVKLTADLTGGNHLSGTLLDVSGAQIKNVDNSYVDNRTFFDLEAGTYYLQLYVQLNQFHPYDLTLELIDEL